EAGSIEPADQSDATADAQSLTRVRAALLARVEAEQPPRGAVENSGPPTRGRWQGFGAVGARHRSAGGGIGPSSAGAVLLVIAALNSGQRLSAMEQVVKQLQEVTSYSFHLHWESTWTEDDGERQVTSQGDGENYWRAPDAFHGAMKITWTEKELPRGK